MLKKIISLATSSVTQLTIRTSTFFYLSYILSLTEIGYFTFSITISGLAVNVVTFGAYNLIMEKGKSKVDAILFLQKDLLFYVLNVFLFIGLYCFLHSIFNMEIPISLSLLFLVGEILQVGFVFIFSSYFLTINKPQDFNYIRNLNTGIYALMFLLFVFFTNKSIDSWAILYFINSIVFLIFGFLFVKKEFIHNNEKSKFKMSDVCTFYIVRIKEGKHYFISSVVRAFFTASDKLMVALLFGYDKLGIYSLAEKAIMAFNIPLTAFLQLNEPKYYQVGGEYRYKLILSVLPISFIYFLILFICYKTLGHDVFNILSLPDKFFDPFLLLNFMLVYIFSINMFNSLMHYFNGVGKVKHRIYITIISIVLFFSLSKFSYYTFDSFNVMYMSMLFAVTQITVSLPFYIRYLVNYVSIRRSFKNV